MGVAPFLWKVQLEVPEFFQVQGLELLRSGLSPRDEGGGGGVWGITQSRIHLEVLL